MCDNDQKRLDQLLADRKAIDRRDFLRKAELSLLAASKTLGPDDPYGEELPKLVKRIRLIRNEYNSPQSDESVDSFMRFLGYEKAR